MGGEACPCAHWWAPALPGQRIAGQRMCDACAKLLQSSSSDGTEYMLCIIQTLFVIMSILHEAPKGEVHFVRLSGGHEMLHRCSGARCYTPCDIAVMVPNGILRQKKSPGFHLCHSIIESLFVPIASLSHRLSSQRDLAGPRGSGHGYQGALQDCPVNS